MSGRTRHLSHISGLVPRPEVVSGTERPRRAQQKRDVAGQKAGSCDAFAWMLSLLPPRAALQAPRSPALTEAALALASLRDALPSLEHGPDAESPDTQVSGDGTRSSEDGQQSDSDSDDDEPWGVDWRTVRRLWTQEEAQGTPPRARERGFYLTLDVDTESEDYSSGGEAEESARQRGVRAAREGQAALRAVALDAQEAAAAIALAQAVQRQRQESRQRHMRVR